MEHVTEHLPAVQSKGAGSAFVTMSNALTRAAQSMSLPEMRILALAVSKLDSKAPAYERDRNGRLVPVELVSKLHARDYAEAFGVSEEDGYKVLKAAAIKLLRRLIVFYVPAHRRDGKPLADTKRVIQWASACEYQKGSGEIRIEWHKEVVPHLLGLQKHFTIYRLAQIRYLRHKSSIRLLALLEMFKKTGVAEFTLEDFCMSMDVAPSFLNAFGMLRKRVIEPAVGELNEHSDFIVTWEPKKTGRKITSLRFTFKPNPQGTLDFGG